MVTQDLQPKTYHTPECIHWCVDAAQVILIDQTLGRLISLDGLQAAIWSWLSLGYDLSRIASLIAISKNQSLSEARHSVQYIVNGWIADGLLIEK